MRGINKTDLLHKEIKFIKMTLLNKLNRLHIKYEIFLKKKILTIFNGNDKKLEMSN